MKTFKILFAAIIIAGFATSAMAQDTPITSNANLTASAQIIVEVDVNKVSDLAFGEVAPNTNPTIDPVDNDNNTNETGASMGKFSVTATPFTNFQVSWTSSNLSHTTETGAADLVFTPKVAITSDNDATEGGLFTSGEEYISDEEGVDYFLIGGDIVVPTGAFAGTYDSVFTLTAEHVL